MVPQPPITTLEVRFERELLVSKGTFKFRKRHKSLINMAHPEGFEPPATWLEARYPTVVFFPLSATFIADNCTTFVRNKF